MTVDFECPLCHTHTPAAVAEDIRTTRHDLRVKLHTRCNHCNSVLSIILPLRSIIRKANDGETIIPRVEE